MKSRIKILLVEDDAVQAQWIKMQLRRAYGSEPEWISTESDFHAGMSKIVQHPPNIVILDVMLSWAEASRSIPKQPDDVRQEGMYRAGLRCQELLAKASATCRVPVILYTVQDLKDLGSEIGDMPESVIYLPKEAEIEPLLEKIDSLVG